MLVYILIVMYCVLALRDFGGRRVKHRFIIIVIYKTNRPMLSKLIHICTILFHEHVEYTTNMPDTGIKVGLSINKYKRLFH